MIITMLFAIFGANFYVFYRLWNLLPEFPANKIILTCLGLFMTLAPFISIGIGNRLPFSMSSFMYQVGTSWLIILIYLVIIFLLFDLVKITGLLPVKQMMFHNLTSFGILLLFIVSIMTFGNVKYNNKKRIELTLKTGKNITTDKPIKIVAISDLHLGYGIKPKEFQKWVHLINKEEPDFVLIAGDAIDNSLVPLYKRNYADVFKEIKSKHGIYMVLGNHEYISGVNESVDYLTKAGVVMLKDSVALVDNICYIAGRDDKSNSKRKSIAELTDSLDKSKPVILIDHQPFHFSEVAENNIDLFIAGHTHGGQVFPISLITNAIFECSYGYVKKRDTHFYVTSGIGIWGGKFRIGSCSEYVVINLF